MREQDLSEYNSGSEQENLAFVKSKSEEYLNEWKGRSNEEITQELSRLKAEKNAMESEMADSPANNDNQMDYWLIRGKIKSLEKMIYT